MSNRVEQLKRFLVGHFDASQLSALIEDLPDGKQLLGEISMRDQDKLASFARGLGSQLSQQPRFQEPFFAALELARPDGAGLRSVIAAWANDGRATAQSCGGLRVTQAVDSPESSLIKILLVCANPRGTDQLRLGEEDRTLRECIQLSTNRERFKVETLNAATIDDLRRELLRHNYDIVQISGHGTDAGLVFEDVNGDCVTPDPAALSELLQRRGVNTVVLNACYSLSAGSFRGMGLEYTVAMVGPIADQAAVEFTRGFYDALGEGLTVADAHAEGVSCCKLKRLSLRPALFEKGELISGGAPTTDISPEPEKIPERNTLKQSEAPANRVGKDSSNLGKVHCIRLVAPIGGHLPTISLDQIKASVSGELVDDGLQVALNCHDGQFEGLLNQLDGKIRPYLKYRVNPSGINKLALFAFAPIPVLIAFGRVLGDKHPAEVFDYHRHSQSWSWDSEGADIGFACDRPIGGPRHQEAALFVSISGDVVADAQRVVANLDDGVDCYAISVPNPRPNLVRTRRQLNQFAELWQQVMAELRRHHERIHLFPAMPLSVSVLCGCHLLPKVDPELKVYDYRGGAFRHSLTFGE